MNTQTARQFLNTRWRTIALWGSLFAAMAILQFVLLGSLTNGFSANEVQAYHAGTTLHDIWHDPLNAPFELLVLGIRRFVRHGSLYSVRLAAAIIGSATVGVFAALLNTWYGKRTALLGTALFGSSSWFLHTSRLGTPGVLLFGIFMLVAVVAWARRTHRPAAWLTCIILATAVLYVPGAIWFLVVGLLWQVRTFGGLAWQRRWVSLGGGFLAIAGLVPLAWTLYRSPHLLKPWLGLPAHWASTTASIKNILAVPVHVLVRGPGWPQHWLGHLPMLDLLSVVMLVFGGYALAKYSRRLAIGFTLFFVVACVLVGLGGIGLAVLAPFVYLLVAGGVHELLGRWLRVFPRNPIARQLGVGLMACVVTLACVYNIRAYFIAWPQSSTTEAAFTHRHP